MTIPDALSRAFAAYHEVMGDTGVWHEVEHGKGKVIKVTTPSKFSIPLNQDIVVAAVEQDLWRKVVGFYAVQGAPPLWEKNFEEDDNILPDAIVVPHSTVTVTRNLQRRVSDRQMVRTDMGGSAKTL